VDAVIGVPNDAVSSQLKIDWEKYKVMMALCITTKWTSDARNHNYRNHKLNMWFQCMSYHRYCHFPLFHLRL
jgi:hypothetical protein